MGEQLQELLGNHSQLVKKLFPCELILFLKLLVETVFSIIQLHLERLFQSEYNFYNMAILEAKWKLWLAFSLVPRMLIQHSLSLFFFFFSPTLLASGLKEQTKDLDTVVHALQILMSFLNNCHEYVSCMDGLCLYLCVVLNAFYGKHQSPEWIYTSYKILSQVAYDFTIIQLELAWKSLRIPDGEDRGLC